METILHNGKAVYLDNTDNRWKYQGTNRWAPNPIAKRCKHIGCNNRVRNASDFCAKHVDWKSYSHGASLLTDADVAFISENYQTHTDFQLRDHLLKSHTETKTSILNAIRHYRRKYLSNRYEKLFYKSVKQNYHKSHQKCEVCGWNEYPCDIHHIFQEKSFLNKEEYHLEKNLITLCPNHHREFEYTRKRDLTKYGELVKKYKNERPKSG